MEKNNQISSRQMLSELRTKINNLDPNTINSNNIDDYNSIIDKISERLKAKESSQKGLLFFSTFLVVISVVSICLAVIMNDYSKNIESKLDNVLKNSSKKDSLFDKYLGVDSLGNYQTTRERGKLMSYKDLDISRDSIKHENFVLLDSINILNTKLNMAKENYGIYYSQKKLKNKTFITIGSTKFEEMEKSGKDFYKKVKPLVDSINK